MIELIYWDRGTDKETVQATLNGSLEDLIFVNEKVADWYRELTKIEMKENNWKIPTAPVCEIFLNGRGIIFNMVREGVSQ